MKNERSNGIPTEKLSFRNHLKDLLQSWRILGLKKYPVNCRNKIAINLFLLTGRTKTGGNMINENSVVSNSGGEQRRNRRIYGKTATRVYINVL